jgi:hypothetical protein
MQEVFAPRSGWYRFIHSKLFRKRREDDDLPSRAGAAYSKDGFISPSGVCERAPAYRRLKGKGLP